MPEMTFEHKNQSLKHIVTYLSGVIADRARTNPAYQHSRLQELIGSLLKALNSIDDPKSINSYVIPCLSTPWESWINTEAGSMPELAAIRYLLHRDNHFFERSPDSAQKLIDAFFQFVKDHGEAAQLFCYFQASGAILVPVEELLAIHGVTDPELITVTRSVNNPEFLKQIVTESIQAHSLALLRYLKERGYLVIASSFKLDILESVLAQYSKSTIFEADKELSVLQVLVNEEKILSAISDEAIESILYEYARKAVTPTAAYSEDFARYDFRAAVGNTAATEKTFFEFSLKVIALLRTHRPRVWKNVSTKIAEEMTNIIEKAIRTHSTEQLMPLVAHYRVTATLERVKALSLSPELFIALLQEAFNLCDSYTEKNPLKLFKFFMQNDFFADLSDDDLAKSLLTIALRIISPTGRMGGGNSFGFRDFCAASVHYGLQKKQYFEFYVEIMAGLNKPKVWASILDQLKEHAAWSELSHNEIKMVHSIAVRAEAKQPSPAALIASRAHGMFSRSPTASAETAAAAGISGGVAAHAEAPNDVVSSAAGLMIVRSLKIVRALRSLSDDSSGSGFRR